MLSSVAIGEKELQLLANAATPYLFKQTFKLDLMKVFSGLNSDNGDISEVVNLLPQLSFIMNKQAEGLKPSEFIRLNEDAFYEWLADFGAMDFTYASDKIIGVYMGNQASTSAPKKKAGQQIDK